MNGAPTAAVVVRNTASHDARVMRCARALRALGYEPLVLAVTSEQEERRRDTVGGIPVVRLTPGLGIPSFVRRLRSRLARKGRRAGAGKRETASGRRGDRSPSFAARAYRALRTLSYYRRGIVAVLRLRPAIVHCNDYNTMWIGVAAKLLPGSTVVYDSHELWPDRNGRTEPRWWLLACEALFLRIADLNLATSPGHANEIARRHRVEPPHVIRNIAERGSDPGAPADAENGTAAEPTIVYCGALTGSRGLEQAIAALPDAPGIRLRMIGPGAEAYRERLADLAAAHGVGGRVSIDPPVAADRVVEAISGAEAGLALIQPTCLSYELCLPNKVFEYLVAGLPVLAADLPSIHAFVVPNRVGLVTSPTDTGAVARAMLEIVEPGRNRELRAATARTALVHSWGREAERLRELYRLARERTGAPR